LNGPRVDGAIALDDVQFDLPGQTFFLELAGDQPAVNGVA